MEPTKGSKDSPQTIPPAPDSRIQAAHTVVVGLWAVFKDLLQSNVDTIRIDADTVNETVLEVCIA